MSENDDKARHGLAPWHGTTILLVRKGSDVVLAGDGQVSVGNTKIGRASCRERV